MNRHRYNPGPPGNGNGARQSADPKTENRSDYYTSRVKINRADHWLENYLAFLDHEIIALKAGFIGRQYLNCAEAAYREFLTSQAAQDRFRAWLAIRICCAWLARMEARS
jgi:hypothetical protein